MIKSKKLTPSNQIVPKIRQLVKTAALSPQNKSGYGAWEHHIKVVVKYAKKLAIVYHADAEIVELAALLHDYASLLDANNDENHEIIGAQLAFDLLNRYGYPAARIHFVQQCILHHRASRPQLKSSVEELCVAHADAIAHICQVGSLFYLCFTKHHLNIRDSEIWISAKIDRSWHKLSPVAQKMIRSQYLAAQMVLKHKTKLVKF